jgi:capsular polysaccharide biosynthesis protein
MSFHYKPIDASAILRPETISRRKLPHNFNQQDLSLFEHELERKIPQTRLLEFHNINVSSEGLLFHGGKLLPESFAFPANRANWKRRSVFRFLLNNYVLRKRRRFERDSVYVIDDWSAGYFHWLADVLPRLLTVKKRLSDWVLLLPQAYKELDFVQASLRPFAFAGIEYIDPHEALLCSRIMVPTQTAPSGHYNEALIQEVRSLMIALYGGGPQEQPADKIYISRGGATKRRLFNEQNVIDVLREFGFRIIRAEDHSFAEQVQIASRARYLVSNHGAGLTNMLFMIPGTNVLELRYATDRVNNCYFTLASALNLNYFYQSCEPVNRGEDSHTADLKVDAPALRANLELMLKSA